MTILITHVTCNVFPMTTRISFCKPSLLKPPERGSIWITSGVKVVFAYLVSLLPLNFSKKAENGKTHHSIVVTIKNTKTQDLGPSWQGKTQQRKGRKRTFHCWGRSARGERKIPDVFQLFLSIPSFKEWTWPQYNSPPYTFYFTTRPVASA